MAYSVGLMGFGMLIGFQALFCHHVLNIAFIMSVSVKMLILDKVYRSLPKEKLIQD